MNRRLPVYLLIDVSGSMKGEPIEAVKVGISSLVSSLRTDPHALDSVHLSLVTFARVVTTLVPLTPLDQFVVPNITEPETGPTHTGAALHAICDAVRSDLKRSTKDQKGDWRPLLFVMTDGPASDVQYLNEVIPDVKSISFASVIGCAAGPKARVEELQRYCGHVVSLDTMDGHGFHSFFKWVSSAVAGGNLSTGVGGDLKLPPPPSEVNIVC